MNYNNHRIINEMKIENLKSNGSYPTLGYYMQIILTIGKLKLQLELFFD